MREQSVVETKIKIRGAKSGREISEAIKTHFRVFKPVGECQSSWKDLLEDLNTPIGQNLTIPVIHSDS